MFCRLCALLRSILASSIAVSAEGSLTSVRREIGTVRHFDQPVSVNDCDDLASGPDKAFPLEEYRLRYRGPVHAKHDRKEPVGKESLLPRRCDRRP